MKRRILSVLLMSAILVGITGCNTAENKPVATVAATTPVVTTTVATTNEATTTTSGKDYGAEYREQLKKEKEESDKFLDELFAISGFGTSTATSATTNPSTTAATTADFTTTSQEESDADDDLAVKRILGAAYYNSLEPPYSDYEKMCIRYYLDSIGEPYPPEVMDESVETTSKPSESTCSDKYHKSAMEKDFTICPRCGEKLTASTTETPVEQNKEKDHKTFKELYNSGELEPGTFVETTEDGTTATYTLIYESTYDIVLPEKIVFDYTDGTNTVMEGIWNIEGRFAFGTIITTYTIGITERINWKGGLERNGQWYMCTGEKIYSFADGTTIMYSGNWNSEGHIYNGLIRVDAADGSYDIYDGTWENGMPDNGTYKIFDTNKELQYRGKVKNGRFGNDWERIVGNYMQAVGEVIEGEEPIWSIALEEIGEVVADHGALSSFD